MTATFSTLPDTAVPLHGHRGDVFKAVPLPGRRRVVTACTDNVLRIFCTSSGQLLHTLQGPHSLADLTVTPGGTILCTGQNPLLQKWVPAGDPNQYVMMSASITSPIANKTTFAAEPVMSDVVQTSSCVALSDSSFVICARWDIQEYPPGMLHRWYQSKRTMQVEWDDHNDLVVQRTLKEVEAIALAAYNQLVVGLYYKMPCIFSTQEGVEEGNLKGHPEVLQSLAVGEDYIVTGSADKTLRVFDAETYDMVNSFQAHHNSITSLTFWGEERVLSGSRDKTIALHDVNTGECLWRVNVGFRIHSVAIVHDDRIVAVGKARQSDAAIPNAFVIPVPPKVSRRDHGKVRKLAINQEPEFEVFISHAGPDKLTVAIPLYDALVAHNIRTFVDKEELKPGDDATQSMIDAMETAPVLVVITSPEYCSRKWTIKELQCVLQRDEEAKKAANVETSGVPLPGECGRPIIVPVFYRLGVRQCKNLNLATDVHDEDQDNMQRYWDMLNRLDAEIGVMRGSMAALGRWTGIENELKVTNEDTDEMKERRDVLIGRVVRAVVDAVETVRSRGAGWEENGKT